jgi:hypothetical protein
VTDDYKTSPRGSTPVPDPTELTDKAIAKLKEQMEQFVGGKVDLLKGDIKAEHDLNVEKFNAAERLRVEQKKDTKDAVDAALSAAKEAVKEQAGGSDKLIDGLRREVDSLREREGEDVRTLRQEIGNVATVANGTVQQRTGAVENRSGLYAALAAIGGVILLGLAILAAVLAAKP